MTRFVRSFWLVCWLSFGFAASGVIAAPKCPDRPIKLAFLETPTLYVQGKGLDQDIVDELALRSGCRFYTEALPRTRTWVEIEHGRIDMTMAVLPTPERERSMWLINYIQLRNYVILPKAKADQIKSLDDFLAAPNDFRLGVVRGFKYGDTLDTWLNELTRKGRVDDVLETEILYKMLQSNRLAAIIASPLSYPQKLQEYGLTDQVVIREGGGSSAARPRSIGLSRRNFSEVEVLKWQALIDTMQRDGTVRRLIGKYLGKKETEALLLP